MRPIPEARRIRGLNDFTRKTGKYSAKRNYRRGVEGRRLNSALCPHATLQLLSKDTLLRSAGLHAVRAWRCL